MGIGKEISGSDDSGEAGIVEACKRKVLKVYPNAELFVMNPKGFQPKYYVQYWSKSRAFRYLSRYQKTKDDAWIMAWEQIQKNMVTMLEQ